MQQFIGFSSLEEKQVSLRDANGAMVAAREMAAACSKMSGARTAGSQLDVLNEVIQIGDRLISSVNSAATSSARTHTLAFLLTGSGRLVREQLLCITRHHKQLNGLAGGSELQRLVGELGRTLEQWARFLSCPVPSESSTCVSTAATKFETQSSRVLSVVLRKRRDSGMAEGLEHCWNLWTASCSLLAAIKHNFSNDTTECARISDECRHHTAVMVSNAVRYLDPSAKKKEVKKVLGVVTSTHRDVVRPFVSKLGRPRSTSSPVHSNASSRPPVPARVRTNTVATVNTPPFFGAMGGDVKKEVSSPEARFGGNVPPRATGRSPLRKAASETNLKRDQRGRQYGLLLHANTAGTPIGRPRGPAPPPPVHRRAPGMAARNVAEQFPLHQKSPIQRQRPDDVGRNVVSAFEMFPWFESEWGKLSEEQRRASFHHINQLLQV